MQNHGVIRQLEVTLTLAEREGPEETFQEVLGDDLLLQFEGREDRCELGVLDRQQAVRCDALDHAEVDEGEHCVAGSLHD